MNINKLINELKKLLSDKKANNILVILLILFFMIIVYNFFAPKVSSVSSVSKTTNKTDYEDVESAKYSSEYEKNETNALVNLLEEMDGVGIVKVKINFEGDEVKVPAYENTSQASTTKENDNSGGTRTTEQDNKSTSIVKSNDEPYILQVNNPKIIGIAVIAEGASDNKIKDDIVNLVCSLYDLPVNKVNVYPRK